MATANACGLAHSLIEKRIGRPMEVDWKLWHTTFYRMLILRDAVAEGTRSQPFNFGVKPFAGFDLLVLS